MRDVAKPMACLEISCNKPSNQIKFHNSTRTYSLRPVFEGANKTIELLSFDSRRTGQRDRRTTIFTVFVTKYVITNGIRTTAGDGHEHSKPQKFPI